VPASPAPTPTTSSREIPLRRQDGDTAELDGEQTLYRLVEEGTSFGDVVAAYLDGDEMMCVRHLDLSPARCTCWIGPLENAGVRGGGLLGVRRIVILSGSAEEAALALIEDWNENAGSAAEQEACIGDRLSIAYDGGVIRPEPQTGR
jgi:hypothetical protein